MFSVTRIRLCTIAVAAINPSIRGATVQAQDRLERREKSMPEGEYLAGSSRILNEAGAVSFVGSFSSGSLRQGGEQLFGFFKVPGSFGIQL